MKDIFINEGDFIEKLELDEIYYFTRSGTKVLAVSKDRAVEVKTSLYYITQVLAENPMFLRSHKSFIINIRKIEKISKYTNRSYNIKFKNTQHQAFITQKNLKLLLDKVKLI